MTGIPASALRTKHRENPSPSTGARPDQATRHCPDQPKRHIAESTVTIIVVKPITAICGDVQVFVAIVIVIADRHSHAVTRAL
jgi:hypothetical protein